MDRPNEQTDGAIEPSVRHLHPQRVSREICRYCGARLTPGYYFCPACATPYKSPDAMIAHIKPVPLTESELIRARAPHVMTVFWTYAAVILGLTVFCEFAFQEKDLHLRLILQTAGMFITTCIFAVTHWQSLAVQFRRFGFDRTAAWIGLAALVPLLAINFFYHSWIRSLLDAEREEPELGHAAMFFFFCLCPAVLEEIAFRGLVQHWLTAAIRPMRAIILASALFTALHFSIISFPYLFAVGMLLGWTKWKTNSLYPSILKHFLHNWIVLEYFPML